MIVTEVHPACEAKRYRKKGHARHGKQHDNGDKGCECQLSVRASYLARFQAWRRTWIANLLCQHLSYFILYYLATFGVALWVTPASVWAQSNAAAAQPIRVAKAQRDVGVYTDMNRFMESRLKKLGGIVQRARAAQQKIRAKPAHRRSLEDQKALQTWRDIERRARAMIAEINSTLDTARQKAQRRQVNKSITLTRMDGGRERMATHRGAVVLLHFWATWCRPCIKEIDVLDVIHQRFRNQNFKLVAVSLDARKKDVKHFMSKRNLRFPVYMDSGRTIYQQIIGGAEVLPRSLLINKSGQIIHTYAGAQHLESLATSSDIRTLLARP